MPNRAPEFETADKKGTTTPYSGNVGTSWTPIPGSGAGKIQSFAVINDDENSHTEYLEISLDGGTSVYDKLWPGGHLEDTIKGDSITQIHIRGQSSSVAYRVFLDREPV
jgi:hypothetical protein